MKITAQEILSKILKSKGQFVKASWKSNPSPKASFKGTNLEKVHIGIIRAGINYSNLASVQQGIETGLRGEVQELPWGQWELFPYLITHKSETYIRLYPSSHKTITKYFVNSVEVDSVKFCEYLTPSAAAQILNPDSENPLACFTVKASNILDIPEEIAA